MIDVAKLFHDNLDCQYFLKAVIFFRRQDIFTPYLINVNIYNIYNLYMIYYSFKMYYSKIFDQVPKCRYGSTCI